MWNSQQGIERTKQDRLLPNSEENARELVTSGEPLVSL